MSEKNLTFSELISLDDEVGSIVQECDDTSTCLLCGGDNEVVTTEVIEGFVCECDCKCKSCGNEASWAYGRFNPEDLKKK